MQSCENQNIAAPIADTNSTQDTPVDVSPATNSTGSDTETAQSEPTTEIVPPVEESTSAESTPSEPVTNATEN